MSELPEVTHEGAIDLLGFKVRVYRLTNGQTVFNAEDTHEVLQRMMAGAGDLPVDLVSQIQSLMDDAFVEFAAPPSTDGAQ